MLSLTNSSICDVCAEEYGTGRVPHCIPCGHILCKTCCNTIIEKTPAGRTPVCPFCRLNFAADGIRKLRLDLNASASGPSTPRTRSNSIEAHAYEDHYHRGVLKEDNAPISDKDRVRLRGEARRLEEKVARIAAKRCSVEEVAAVLKEVDCCLRALEVDEHPMSLVLSSSLLRAILTNYHAHDHTTKAMKAAETNLRTQVADLENAAGNLQAELRKLKAQQNQKAQECQSLRVELNRTKIKAAASSLALPGSALGLTSTSFGTAVDSVYSDSSRPTSPISPMSDYSTGRSSSSSRSQTPSVIGSPLRHLMPLPASSNGTPMTSPLSSPHVSPGYISSPRYATTSSLSSASSPQHRSSSVMGHRSVSSTSSSTISSSSHAASIDRSRTPVASSSGYPTVVRPTSPSPAPRPSGSRRSSTSMPVPPIIRSASDEENDPSRYHASTYRTISSTSTPSSSSSRSKERTNIAAGFVQRWLPGQSDARAPSAPPSMSSSSRSSHSRTASMQAHMAKSSMTSPLSASAAARAVRA